jgi:hypothetical protein
MPKFNKEEVDAARENQKDFASDDRLMPRGDYPFVVSDAVDETAQSGNEMTTFTIDVSEGDFEGKRFWERIVHPDQGVNIMWKWNQFHDSVGLSVDEDADIDNEEYIGMEGVMTVGYENYEGEKRNVIKGFKPRIVPDKDTHDSARPTKSAASPRKTAGGGLPLPR